MRGPSSVRPAYALIRAVDGRCRYKNFDNQRTQTLPLLFLFQKMRLDALIPVKSALISTDETALLQHDHQSAESDVVIQKLFRVLDGGGPDAVTGARRSS